MTDTTATTPTAPVEQKPTEISVSYRGPDLKTLAIGGGLLAGAIHASSHALGTLIPTTVNTLSNTAAPAAAAALLS